MLLRFIEFLTVFFQITQWSVGRPVPPMRFSGPRRTRGKKAVAIFDDVVMNCTEDFQAPTYCEFSCQKQTKFSFKKFHSYLLLVNFYFRESFRGMSLEVNEVEVSRYRLLE